MNYQGQPPQPKKGMPWWVILLICLGLCVVIGIVAVAGILIWVGKNAKGIAEGSQAAITEGQAFGGTHDQNACVDEALVRTSKCDGIFCMAQQQSSSNRASITRRRARRSVRMRRSLGRSWPRRATRRTSARSADAPIRDARR